MQKILNTFIAEKIDGIKSDYNWRIKEEHLPVEVNFALESNYMQNLLLKHQLHDLYTAGQNQQQLEIITYYIKKWGHIYGNKEETLRTFTEYNCEDIINTKQTKGIASWSKALCVRGPQTYAIFDARVSATLNLLLLDSTDETEKLFFPRLPSRNQTIRKINQLIQESRVSYRSNRVVYREYLTLIHNAANHVRTDIHTIEMILFSHPENLFETLFK